MVKITETPIWCPRNGRSYQSAHILLNLLNKLGKREKMQGLPSVLSLFHNEFDKFNNIGAQMLDYIYYMILKSLFWYKNVKVLSLCKQFIMDVIN